MRLTELLVVETQLGLTWRLYGDVKEASRRWPEEAGHKVSPLAFKMLDGYSPGISDSYVMNRKLPSTFSTPLDLPNEPLCILLRYLWMVHL